MLGQRSTGARRARGSWLPRLAGIGAVVVLAGAGVIASLVTTKPAAATHRPLPAKVLTVQTVGLVDPGPPPPPGGTTAPQMLLDSPGGLAFGPVPQSSLVTGNPEWTADQMVDGSYIFIYAPNGQCLASALSPRTPTLVLRRCDLGRSQRWRRLNPAVESAGRTYAEFSNVGTGRCMSAGSARPAAGQGAGQGGSAAELAPCRAAAPWRQLLSFWWAA